jgi:hypothetical protein
LTCKKYGNETDSSEHIKDYDPCQTNDIVDALIQLDGNCKCTLSFYVDGKFVGRVFKDIEGPVCPCIHLGLSGNIQISMNTLSEVPLELSNYGC